jgi:putative FmdB family regulatory protein
MPVYEYQCVKCGHVEDAVRRIADRDNGPLCEDCSIKMGKLILTPPRGFVTANLDYRCVATGQNVSSWAQRNRIMDEHELMDVRELDPPDWDQMAQDSSAMQELADTPEPELPDEVVHLAREQGLLDSASDGIGI